RHRGQRARAGLHADPRRRTGRAGRGPAAAHRRLTPIDRCRPGCWIALLSGIPGGDVRIGIDIGASKIEAAALAAEGAIATRQRLPTPTTYRDTLGAIAALVDRVEAASGAPANVGAASVGATSVGIGFPGRID